MPVPHDSFFQGTARAAWYVGMVLDINGLPRPSVHPLPSPPVEPFGVGRESGCSSQVSGSGTSWW